MVGTAQMRLLPTLRVMFAVAPYFTAEKRLSNEFVCMIGAAPATMPSFAGEAAPAGVSESEGFSGGRPAGLVSDSIGVQVFSVAIGVVGFSGAIGVAALGAAASES